MTQTTSTQMIIPEVWADLAQAEFQGKLIFGQPGFAASDNTLVGRPGDRINFPSWNAMGDVGDLTEGTPITPEQLTTDPGDTAVIKEIGKAVELTDKAQLVGSGDPNGEARRQLATVAARKVDTDLKLAAEGTTHAVSVAATFTYSTMVKAIAEYGDEWDPDEIAGLVVHSKVHTDMLNLNHFVSRDKVGDLAVIPRGFVGSIGGVPVVVSDRITVNAGPTYTNLLVRRGALGTLYKRRPVVETDRDILTRTDVVTIGVHYAVKLLDADGVVTITTQ